MASKLDPYRDEILRDRAAGMPLADILDRLAREYGCLVSISTLSKFLGREAGTDPAVTEEKPLPPEMEHHIEQAVVVTEIRATVREAHAMTGHLVEATKSLAMQSADHRQAVLARLDALASGGSAATHPELLAELRAMRSGLAQLQAPALAPFSARQLRRIWWRALWITALFWLAVAAAIWWGVSRFGAFGAP